MMIDGDGNVYRDESAWKVFILSPFDLASLLKRAKSKH
jgi:formamidopyrimidine-DNA glycosylase